MRLAPFLFASILAVPCAAAENSADAIRAKLDRAKARYEAETEKNRESVNQYFDKQEAAIRKTGDKKQLDRLKGERTSFTKDGEIPKAAPKPLSQRFGAARATLEKAYETAVREYVIAKEDDRASAAENELKEFRARAPLSSGPQPPKDAVKFDGRFFKVLSDNVTWHEAQKRCAAMGGRLAIIRSDKENVFVNQLVAAKNLGGAWLGATDEKEEGKWIWPTGEVMGFNKWSTAGGQQPNNGGRAANEHYLVELVRFEGAWCDQPDKPKEANIGFVCEW